ncbi:50S ribosomal protein L11 methyltransferase [Solimonas sp. C16B3]|uniref:Ribosomal protein L11 methyltransferase n=1 Tax=Solimonas marina TaxID=2714601 RepID=A0A970B9X8_9GAMM|nr:50S ribosomal protein L11 methyltransferase [Solimonas marina]NKF23814.1 50S ribosomal protein L11 methyltransferase [Solimonas marina]
MAWLQLRVSTRHPEFADEILLAHGASAVSYIDAVDDPVLEPAPGETPLWANTVTLGLFTEGTDLDPVQAGLRELLPDGTDARFEVELIEDQDWVRVWLKDCPPLQFGDKLWVVPHEKVGEVTQEDAVLLRLDPGLAFGTGTHPTTALCLQWLAERGARGELAGKTVLDFGCGSGVLAIAALLLGAERAIGVDIDPQALLATRDNAAANGVGDRIVTLPAEHFVPLPADIIVANILANPLIALAPTLAGSIRQGGDLVMAGLLDRQAEDVRDAYVDWFDFDDDASKDGWTRLSARCRMPALVGRHRVNAKLLTSGQPWPEQFATLRQAGIDAVINLSSLNAPNHLEDEAARWHALDVDHTMVEIPWETPTREHAEAFFNAMHAYEGRHVLVHCALGKRAATLVYLYRVLHRGEARDVALADLHAVWQPEPAWQALIDELLAE